MRRLKNILGNQRGFMLINVVFLTVITSFAAMILMDAAPRIRNNQTSMRLIALNLANEQFAYLESRAARGLEPDAGFLGEGEDLINDSFGNENMPINFTVETSVTGGGNLRSVTVTVKWQSGGENFEIESERTIRIVETS
ncbi:MAG: hypothetical protein K6G55_03280 [Selenomonadaceae bacterium]|nr:hypothetical protein [Selenomonadaceae bacterium]